MEKMEKVEKSEGGAPSDLRRLIREALLNFSQKNGFAENAEYLLNTLGYASNRKMSFEQKDFAEFEKNFLQGGHTFNAEKARAEEWNYFDILFQLSDAEISTQNDLWNNKQVDNTIINSYLFVAIGLKGSAYSRSALAQICREVNKVFPMPVMVLFRYGERVTLSVIDRRINKQRGDKDVLERVTLIKDISVTNPHRAHIDILGGLSLEELRRNHTITNWVELHNAWRKTLDTKELNNRFYKDLYNWYEWARTLARFPAGGGEQETRKSLIRLITRLIFVWFIKQKGLIPDDIFRLDTLQNLLHNFDPLDAEGGAYYSAVIQNLFFATLNREIDEREFAEDTKKQHNEQYMIKFYFRDDNEKSFFKIAHDEFVKLFSGVPFLNGGLFECLDYLENSRPIGVDGFSREPSRRAVVPNILFFGAGKTEQGIINIFNRYVFTIEENTPIEQDIALDPELLGKVFENLLATYNPETQESARNETGSFYTPREIVEYMVDTSLKEYLKKEIEGIGNSQEERENSGNQNPFPNSYSLSSKLDALIQYSDEPHGFDEAEKETLINAIDNCKILDPACGSGAFPMGVLHKLTFLLGKLDPRNEKWKEQQKKKLDGITDAVVKNDLLNRIDTAFENGELDYGRKLYLIENCIFGVDIQAIAIQISKLRFFISLIVDQTVDRAKKNLGILPLPNLETKFIAANTLVGLEKPETNEETLWDKDANLLKLEKEILEIRHNLFSARSAKDKYRYRQQDKSKREEIQRELMSLKWDKKSAAQIADWDPYNQNAAGGWFDAEWMFGVKDGFDVVISNPPYKMLPPSELEKYTFSKGNNNTYIAFIEMSLNLAKHNATIAYIIPTTWFGGNKFANFRNAILTNYNLCQIIQLPYDIFKQAYIDTGIVIIKNESPANVTKYYKYNIRDTHNELLIKYFTDFPTSEWLNFGKVFLNNDLLVIGKKVWLSEKNIKLGEISKINRGCLPPKENEKSTKKTKMYNLRWFNDQVFRYTIQKAETIEYVNYDNLKENKPLYLYQTKKILARQLMSRQFRMNLTYTEEEFAFKKNLYAIFDLNSNYDYKFILAILNSTLFSFMQVNFNASLQRDDFPAFSLNDFKEFLIPRIEKTEQKTFVILVDKILAAKAADPQADTSALEREVDGLVYKLYDLTEEEIAVVEGK